MELPSDRYAGGGFNRRLHLLQAPFQNAFAGWPVSPNANNIAATMFKASQGDYDGALAAFLEESPHAVFYRYRQAVASDPLMPRYP